MSAAHSGGPDHLERARAAMDDAGIDVLLLCREGNTRFVSGADRLWLSGTRAVAPGCIVVAETGAVHLLSTTDDGIPGDDARERLVPTSWNPMHLIEHIARLPRVGAARRVGLDAVTPMFEGLLTTVLPDAELVDGEVLLRRVRRHKSASDVERIRGACDVARAALRATQEALAPGITERALQGVFERRMAELGATTPALEASCCVVDHDAPPGDFPTDRAAVDGDVVRVRAGVLRDGWEGPVRATLVCGGPPRAAVGRDEVVARCRSGTAVGDLRTPGVLVDGTGMGHEALSDDDHLEPGMVVSVECSDGVLLGGAVVHVTPGDPETLLRT